MVWRNQLCQEGNWFLTPSQPWVSERGRKWGGRQVAARVDSVLNTGPSWEITHTQNWNRNDCYSASVLKQDPYTWKVQKNATSFLSKTEYANFLGSLLLWSYKRTLKHTVKRGKVRCGTGTLICFWLTCVLFVSSAVLKNVVMTISVFELALQFIS